MTEQFAQPSTPGDGIDWQAVNGSLLLIRPLSIEAGIATVHGRSDAVRASVVVLDGPKAGEKHEDALIFPRVVQGQVRSKIGQLVLGRVGQGVAKPGQTAPWLLQEATQQDIDVATNYMRQAQQPTSASPPAHQVPGQGWGQQPAQHAQPPF